MTRIQLEFVPGQAHELTFSCNKRLPHFRDPELASAFLRCLDEARHDAQFLVHAYVVMPEHCHLIVRPLGLVCRMSEILSAIKNPAAKSIFLLRPELRESVRIPRKNRPDEYRFWLQGGGYDRPISSPEAFRSMLSYIHANPVRRALSEGILDYPFSSAAAYHGGDPLIPVDFPMLDN